MYVSIGVYTAAAFSDGTDIVYTMYVHEKWKQERKKTKKKLHVRTHLRRPPRHQRVEEEGEVWNVASHGPIIVLLDLVCGVCVGV